MSGVAIVTKIVEILGAGITGVASFIGSGLSDLVTNVMFVTVGTGETAITELSMFGTLIIVFAGISLAIGLSRLIVHWLSTLGASRV